MRRRKWNYEQLIAATKNSHSIRSVLQKMGLKEAGGNYAQIHKYFAEYKIDTSHFKGQGWSKGLKGIGKSLIPLEKILVNKSTFQSYKLRNRLFKAGLKKQACELCSWSKKTVDGRVPLELDHINGDRMDNRIENLRILCPNCHSLQSTHRGRNIKRLAVW